MRIGFSSLACPGWTVEQIADAAGRYGYGGVEWRLADGELLGPHTAAGVWDRIASCGREPVCLDTSCRFVRATEEKRARVVDEAIAMAGFAAAIGAPAVRVFGGQFPDGIARADVLGPARDALARAASASPVPLLVETHDAWSLGADAAEL